MQRGALLWRVGKPNKPKRAERSQRHRPLNNQHQALPLTAVLSLSESPSLSLMSTFICVLLCRQKNLGRVGPRLVSVE